MSEPSPRDATGSIDATRPRPPHLGPPRPRTRPGSRAWGGRGGRARESPPREPSGTPCTCVAASCARRCSSPRTPCTCFAPSRARRCSHPRTPCTCFAASRARRCPGPRTPCSSIALSRARRCPTPRTPCTGVAPSGARRSASPHTLCSFLAASRALHDQRPGPEVYFRIKVNDDHAMPTLENDMRAGEEAATRFEGVRVEQPTTPCIWDI